MSLKKYAIIVAAGAGTRMKSVLPKQFMLLDGKPVLWYTLSSFLEAFDDMEIILVLSPDFLNMGKELADTFKNSYRIKIIAGGNNRFQSVKNGLDAVTGEGIAFIHDGVRCLVTQNLIHRCFEMATELGNAVPSLSAVDSMRMVRGNSNEILDREMIRIIQTPQTFPTGILKKAFDQEYDPSFTDEATAVERLGIKIHLLEGESTNIKITRPLDILIAEQILRDRRNLA